MKIDATTLHDLAIFHTEEAQSVYNFLNYTATSGGAHWLSQLLNQPFSQLKPIKETQQLLQLLVPLLPHWPGQITNGTIMVLERYYQSQIDKIPTHPTYFDGISYPIFHRHDFSLIKYTVGHAIDFLQGMHQIAGLFSQQEIPALLSHLLQRMQLLLSHEQLASMINSTNKTALPNSTVLLYGRFLLYQNKSKLTELIDIHSRLDAYISLAKAIQIHGLQFPTFEDAAEPHLTTLGLKHILLPHPVAYDVALHQHSNFIFLTGANMAGKSTFIKAIGIAVYLAHLGMAVPAASMQLSVFDGIISNIQVSDNLLKGESYFYNEVQRIRNTILRISNGQKWLVLIDELFKGTNVQDAMRCSSTVIKGLLKIKDSLFVLSTHLYEIGEELQPYSNITFKYFETTVTDDELLFSYQLKEGVSNDRIGYLILKREGVIDMIDKL